jgi:hypothetical protein
VEKEDVAAYKNVLCSGRSDHRESWSLCFWSAGLLRLRSALHRKYRKSR